MYAPPAKARPKVVLLVGGNYRSARGFVIVSLRPLPKRALVLHFAAKVTVVVQGSEIGFGAL